MKYEGPAAVECLRVWNIQPKVQDFQYAIFDNYVVKEMDISSYTRLIASNFKF
jgi:hypothetical protein